MTDLAHLRKAAAAMKAIDEAKKFNKLAAYAPYPKQQEFHDLGLVKSERNFRAGNRNGKSYCGAYETALHLTGRYPDWWLGRRFTRPIKAWAASDTGITTRDVVQTHLFGPPSNPQMYGSGAVPRECIKWAKDVSTARGVTDLFDTINIEHQTNGVVDGKSILTLKTYEQGRKKWQGDALDVIWLDEEPEIDLYSEAITRTAPTRAGDPGGIVYLTSTPLLGKTKLMQRFMEETNPDRAEINMTLDEAKHIDQAEKDRMVASWPSHEREARRRGVPFMGSGLIFTTPEDALKIEMPNWPAHWYYLWGCDFGFGTDHPFAAVLQAWDKDANALYIMAAVRMAEKRPLDHWEAMKQIGEDVPIAWPQDGTGRDSTGEPLADIYRKHKAKMLPSHATFPDGSISTEAGIMGQTEFMTTGRYKVANHLAQWFEEYRGYHRKDGLIVKKNDDLMSASRIAFMMRRYAKQINWGGNGWMATGPGGPRGPGIKFSDALDFDPFSM